MTYPAFADYFVVGCMGAMFGTLATTGLFLCTKVWGN